ncbi:HNH endonuclease [Mesorhizobium sp. M00.F.Ca.ET.217.01.1.1]|nr:HNH endonuclease [Mesorhizobium sp. M00.F.Ca.ET.217.01.1.1]
MREYQGRRRAEDPAFLARRREVGRRSDARPERRQKQNEQRKFRVTNDNDYRERINARDKDSKKAWKLANPEVVASHRRTRRARLAGAAGNHTAEDIDIIHARQRYRCAECGTSTEDVKHVDHIMPLALGGSNWPDNLQILCPLCNDRKGAKHPLDWAKAKGRLV